MNSPFAPVGIAFSQRCSEGVVTWIGNEEGRVGKSATGAIQRERRRFKCFILNEKTISDFCQLRPGEGSLEGQKMKHYFTLSHVEPGFCVVEADSPWEARQVMLRKLGRKYIEMQYGEKEWLRNGKSLAEIFNLQEMK